MGSIPGRNMDVCQRFPVIVLSCVGRDQVVGLSPTKESYQNVSKEFMVSEISSEQE
jgi:hypothetical protein